MVVVSGLGHSEGRRLLILLGARIVHQRDFDLVLPFWPTFGWRREAVRCRATTVELQCLFQAGDWTGLLTFDILNRQQAFHFDFAGRFRHLTYYVDCLIRLKRTAF